ncbi:MULTISPECIES: helix-turn-helix transcriptional regulator [unclassified Ruminococcus]|uniref:helix-turn-helix transcriptional regulator n=1 Tax=unclassified Ruminococcus TaxID=2608920 RepID=UPI00210A0D8C|nr:MULTISPECIES: helix-turn-helix transcriptional regulator [unclassified Ruminococcus]MCQ4021407.1 helix-turn-helix domain-containing protein [Ruminococcus sp. zg-924]MCQ4113852.1 helix-turn-helix domain-containing protein [Ruminococcus sp. zg-921]
MNIETANRLLQYRKKHSLSQEELAAKIGVSRQAVSKWERAEASPDTDNLILLAQIYGVTLDELLTGKEKVEEETTQEKQSGNENSESTAANDNDVNAQENNTYDSRSGDRVYFDNGLHVDSKNGEHVHVGWSGIHVDSSDGTKVSVDKNGVFVEEKGERKAYTDENGHIIYDDCCKKNHSYKKSIWYKFPYPIVALCVFLAWGFSGFLGGFAYSWMAFLTIPIYYTLVEAIIKKKPNRFCYPVCALIIFFVWGFWGGALGGFAISWIVFLTIPIYYFICSVISHSENS